MSKPENSPGPINVSVADAVLISGLSRSEVYRRLAAKDLEAVKSGKRTLITMDSVRSFLAKLPKATFRPNRSVSEVCAE